MSHQPHKHRTRQDLIRLQGLLSRALSPVSSPSQAPRPDLRLLNLACGSCNEAELLVDLFSRPEILGGDPSAPALRTHLVGVDVRAREIAEAEARCRDYLRKLSKSGRSPGNRELPRQTSFEFLAADATRIASHRELPEDFDVVFLRHQNFYDGPEIWEKIFEQGFEKLAEDGVLVLTSYFEREHELALRAIRKLGGELVTTVENPEARKLSAPGKFVDKHLAVFRKSTGARV